MGGAVNASKSTLLRALRGMGYAALLLTIFEACSGDDTTSPSPPAGPATLEITGIALGQGFFSEGDQASQLLACDYTIGVNVQITNWTLLAPARCGGALQCGQLRVSLLDGASSAELLTVISAGNGVALDVRSLLSADPPLVDGAYTIKVELVDDAGKVYVPLDGGNGTEQKNFSMTLPSACPSTPPGSGGTGGSASGGTSGAGHAGAGGDSAGEEHAGAGGDSNGPSAAGTAGAAGTEGA